LVDGFFIGVQGFSPSARLSGERRGKRTAEKIPGKTIFSTQSCPGRRRPASSWKSRSNTSSARSGPSKSPVVTNLSWPPWAAQKHGGPTDGFGGLLAWGRLPGRRSPGRASQRVGTFFRPLGRSPWRREKTGSPVKAPLAGYRLGWAPLTIGGDDNWPQICYIGSRTPPPGRDGPKAPEGPSRIGRTGRYSEESHG
jgi:hypothetical protein